MKNTELRPNFESLTRLRSRGSVLAASPRGFTFYLGPPGSSIPRLFEKKAPALTFAFSFLIFLQLSVETIALPVIRNTYPRAHKAARSNRESVAAL